MTTGADIRTSIDSIKAELGKGEVVIRGRQTGKTTALLEFVHEYCSGLCTIVTCTPRMAEYMAVYYRRTYPQDEKPLILTLSGLRNAELDGRPRCWVTDEIYPEAAIRNAQALELLTYLGGVGTPICMEMHSR